MGAIDVNGVTFIVHSSTFCFIRFGRVWMTGCYNSLCGCFTLLRMFKNFDGRVYVGVGENQFVKLPWHSF